MYELCYTFLIFFIFSFGGWLLEVTICSITAKKFHDRGFLIGPYCPIYGCAGILMIYFLTPYLKHPVGLFINAIAIASLTEYITSYLMEKLFHARWWDYSQSAFNVNGRICLSISCLFGLLGLFLIYFLEPWLNQLLHQIYSPVLIGISLSLFVLFLIDTLISFRVVSKIKITAENIKKDYTGEITERVKQLLSSSSILNKRLFIAFPNVKAIVSKIKKPRK